MATMLLAVSRAFNLGGSRGISADPAPRDTGPCGTSAAASRTTATASATTVMNCIACVRSAK
eukprot:CAMPEP_0171104120 /NCGR_PEP_ID=MMETSP0766_2-20121228/60040_1 /TAXON_ID=439317 /ORGANISM="Gambierdiscus australes, Strain CAWD 149" /LENGTH=61 /DNA_ID=CAMNT_0011564685 /DNA_START=380 /DNA_END=565 /DNA_ORIENTATION=-